jgi:hypothetical protein
MTPYIDALVFAIKFEVGFLIVVGALCWLCDHIMTRRDTIWNEWMIWAEPAPLPVDQLIIGAPADRQTEAISP